jgi:hypothetical protein
MKADMRKVALAIIAVSGITLVSGIADAGDGGGYPDAPSVVASPVSGVAGFEFTVTVEPCRTGEDVEFIFEGVTELEVCDASSMAQTTFTAPGTAGVYDGTATLMGLDVFDVLQTGFVGFGFLQGESVIDRPLTLDFSITVTPPVDTSSTTTTTTTVAGTTTTVAGTTTTVAGTTTTVSGATTAPADTTAPTTNPSGQLPATGSSGTNSTTNIALGLFAVGLGLLVVAQVRRRQASA